MEEELGVEGYQAIPEAQFLAHADAVEKMRPIAEPSECPGCGAVYYDGHWQWGIAPQQSREHLCPACVRARENHPAAVLLMQGSCVAAHGDEIAALARETESRVRALHPLRRVLRVQQHSGGMRISTSSMYLARDIAAALHHAFRGELQYLYNQEQNALRIIWKC